MRQLKQLFSFIRNVAMDARIPASDKKIILIILALIVSPIDLIPDWIPIIGVLDDVVMVAIILDYFFNRLDKELLLSHFPWTLKTFLRIKRVARLITFLTPGWIKNKIWSYQPSAYTNRFE